MKQQSTIAPMKLGMGVILICLTCSEDGTTTIIEPSNRSMDTAYKLAREEILRYPYGYYKDIEVCSLLRDGNKVQHDSPLIAQWELDEKQHCKRFFRSKEALRLYNDLVRQDVLVLTTNSHTSHRSK